MSFEIKREALITQMKNFVQTCVNNKVTEISKHDSSNVLKPDDEFQFNLKTHYNGYVEEVSEDGYLMSNGGNHYNYDSLGMEELCELFDHLKSKYGFVGAEEEKEVSLTNAEVTGILQLINDNINDRKCDDNDLGYMGLLNLKNKIQN